jgi:hypothetical protein
MDVAGYAFSPCVVYMNDGGSFASDDPLLSAVDELIRWYRNTNAEERDGSGNYTLNARIKQTAQAVERNFVFSTSVGLGLYGGIIATEYASLDAGLHYDLLRVEYTKGRLDTYQYFYQGIDANLLFLNHGLSEERRRPITGKDGWEVIESKEVLPVFGVGAYAFAGGTIAVGFDIIAFLSDFSSIWGL